MKSQGFISNCQTELLLYQAGIAQEQYKLRIVYVRHLCFTQIPPHMYNFGIPLTSIVTSEL